LTIDELGYVGAFRLPAGEANGEGFSFAGGPLAFNPHGNTLFAAARSGKIAEISVPDPVNSADISALPFAKFVQPFADPTDGQMPAVGEGANLAGLLVLKQRLLGTGLIYYDANNTQDVSHFSRALTLSSKSATRFRRIGEKGRAGFVAGYLAEVPAEWQTALGGPAITGQCCIPIITRTSWGPAAFAWDPDRLLSDGDVDATPLVYYDADHRTLGQFEGSNPVFGGTTLVGGLALVGGTRTALFFGSNGTGEFCYGNGTADKALVGKRGDDGSTYCYDPSSSDKGQHAYPYRYQMWAYDLAEWAQVRAKKRKPWDVKPYAVWAFELPIKEAGTRITGVAYDPARRRIFIAQRNADQDGFAFRSLIHVYQVS